MNGRGRMNTERIRREFVYLREFSVHVASEGAGLRLSSSSISWRVLDGSVARTLV